MYNQNVQTVSIRDWISVTIRRRKLVIWSAVICLVIGLAYAFLTKPVYEASAQLLIDPPPATASTIDSANPLSSLFAINQPQSIDTQTDLLQSLPLVDEVTKEVGQATVDVEPVEGTNILQVTTRAGDPQTAAAFANRLVELYMQQDSNRNLDEINAAIDFLTSQEALTRHELNQTEIAIKQFKQKHDLTDLSADTTAQLQQVSALNASIQNDQSDLAGFESGIALDRKSFASEPQATTVLLRTTNPEITSLRDQIRALQVQRTGLTQPGGYTAKSAKVMALDAQIALLEQRLARQPVTITSQSAAANDLYANLHANIVNVQAQAAETSSEIAVLNRQLAQAKQRLSHFNAWQMQFAELSRQDDAEVASDSMFNQQLTELSLRAKAQRADAQVVQNAYIPLAPVAPKRALAVVFSLLIGLFVGACAAIAMEFFDDRLHYSAQADQALKLPVLGHLPMIPTTSPRLLPHMSPTSPELESFKVLRTNVLFSAFDRPIKTLLITSPCAGEGKTTLAINLACAMAMDGMKVVLVDSDLRQPSLHKQLDAASEIGLSDVLAGKAALRDVLMVNSDMPGLEVVLSGAPPEHPGELLNSRRFRRIRDELSRDADLVIFDSPPVLSAADSLILASQMDGTLLVVEMGETRERAAARAMALLQHARAKILGVTYNKIPTGFGGDYYYSQYAYRGRPADDPAGQPTAIAKRNDVKWKSQ